MKTKRLTPSPGRRHSIAVAVALMFATGSAFASTQSVELKYVGSYATLETPLNLPLGSQTYIVGEENFQISGESSSFAAFCVDPFQWASTAPKTYSVSFLDQAAGLNAGKVAQVEKLFGHAFADIGTNAVKAAGFQLALWEVFNDNGNLATGNVKTTSNTNLLVKAEAQRLLDALPGWTTVGTNYELRYYQNASYQDYLSATAITTTTAPIPEPSSAALTLAGLGLTGLLMRRRNRREK